MADQRMIELVRELVGKPFEWHGRGPAAYDCWGLVYYCLRKSGVECPDYRSCEDPGVNAAAFLEAMANGWAKLPAPRPGAVVLFKMEFSAGTHVGFMVSRDLFLHTTEKTGGGVLERLSSPLWRRRVVGFYEWRGHEDPAAVSPALAANVRTIGVPGGSCRRGETDGDLPAPR